MAELKSHHIIQIDATVITGLLILLTIQIATPTPTGLVDFDETEKLKKEQNIKYLTYLDVINKLKEKLNSTNVNDKERIQAQIDDYEAKYYEASAEYDRIASVSEFYRTVSHKPMIDESFPKQQVIQGIAILVMIPFGGSAIWEIISTFDKKLQNNDRATSGAKIWMIIGFFIMIIGLFVMFQIMTKIPNQS